MFLAADITGQPTHYTGTTSRRHADWYEGEALTARHEAQGAGEFWDSVPGCHERLCGECRLTFNAHLSACPNC